MIKYFLALFTTFFKWALKGNDKDHMKRMVLIMLLVGLSGATVTMGIYIYHLWHVPGGMAKSMSYPAPNAPYYPAAAGVAGARK